MFDPFSAIIGLVGTGVNASNQAMSTALAMENLRWQKQRDREQQRFSQAGRSDVYGNKQRYDPLLNEWDIDLTPMQEGIIRAGEREQHLSLTEDAMRNREKRRRAGERGRQAGQDYQAALAGYKYDQPKNEKALMDELVTLMSMVNEDKARGGLKAVTSQALRTGQGALLPQLIRNQNEALGGTIGETLLKARTGAVSEAASRDEAHKSKYLPALQYYAQLMDAGGDAPIMFSTLPQEKSREQGDMAQMIMKAMMGGGDNVSSAYDLASKRAGAGIDFSGLQKGFSGMFSPTGTGATAMMRPSYPEVDRTNKSDYGVF